MFLPLQADEKGQHFLVPSQAVKRREISHSFLTDVQRMGAQGKCLEVHPAQNMLCISKKCRCGDSNYCLPECWDKELISVVRGHHYCSYPQRPGTCDFDKEHKDSAGLKGQRMKGGRKSPPAS